jgi:hypothetical protein
MSGVGPRGLRSRGCGPIADRRCVHRADEGTGTGGHPSKAIDRNCRFESWNSSCRSADLRFPRIRPRLPGNPRSNRGPPVGCPTLRERANLHHPRTRRGKSRGRQIRRSFHRGIRASSEGPLTRCPFKSFSSLAEANGQGQNGVRGDSFEAPEKCGTGRLRFRIRPGHGDA